MCFMSWKMQHQTLNFKKREIQPVNSTHELQDYMLDTNVKKNPCQFNDFDEFNVTRRHPPLLTSKIWCLCLVQT